MAAPCNLRALSLSGRIQLVEGEASSKRLPMIEVLSLVEGPVQATRLQVLLATADGTSVAKTPAGTLLPEVLLTATLMTRTAGGLAMTDGTLKVLPAVTFMARIAGGPAMKKGRLKAKPKAPPRAGARQKARHPGESQRLAVARDGPKQVCRPEEASGLSDLRWKRRRSRKLVECPQGEMRGSLALCPLRSLPSHSSSHSGSSRSIRSIHSITQRAAPGRPGITLWLLNMPLSRPRHGIMSSRQDGRLWKQRNAMRR
mmetsp:Transcript_24272/g.53946  ORF Transcript_24272/g.53946 Transcript_24272/m.53946 type:complete len:257 (-) Transcript_24272:788-1558(-)